MTTWQSCDCYLPPVNGPFLCLTFFSYAFAPLFLFLISIFPFTFLSLLFLLFLPFFLSPFLLLVFCSSAKTLEKIILDDIRDMAQRIVLDEKAIREEFIRHNAEVQEKSIKAAKKELQGKRNRIEELSRLMQLAYEDRLKGKMPEDICISFIQKYSDEQKKLQAEIEELEAKLTETENTIQSADDFIRNIKKYFEAPELTREMCYELIDRIIVGGLPRITGKEREIDIVYKIDIASVLRHKLNNSDK